MAIVRVIPPSRLAPKYYTTHVQLECLTVLTEIPQHSITTTRTVTESNTLTLNDAPDHLPIESPRTDIRYNLPVEMMGEDPDMPSYAIGIKARILTKEEQEQFITHFHNSFSIAATCRLLKINIHSFYATTNINPEFRDAVYFVTEVDRKKVEIEMLRLALGHTQETTQEWLRKFDKKTGEPLNDEHGNPLLILKSKKIKRNPPNDNLLMFLAKIYYPDIFGDKLTVKHQFTYEQPEEVRKRLTDKLLELDTITVNGSQERLRSPQNDDAELLD